MHRLANKDEHDNMLEKTSTNASSFCLEEQIREFHDTVDVATAGLFLIANEGLQDLQDPQNHKYLSKAADATPRHDISDHCEACHDYDIDFTMPGPCAHLRDEVIQTVDFSEGFSCSVEEDVDSSAGGNRDCWSM